MRRPECLLVTLLIITGITAAGSTSNAQDQARNVMAENSEATISASRVKPAAHKLVEQAIQDAITIVSSNDSCGRFYGETKTAEEVLRKLAPRLQVRQLGDSRTGIEMSGELTYFGCKDKQVGYRLFAEATINSRGPFLKAKVFPSEPHIPDVGTFRPNTREARVLMLLHELAHLMAGEDGNWLIPDDGNAPALSRRNTALVESQCKEQILSLSQA
jgi:hypothetical protein